MVSPVSPASPVSSPAPASTNRGLVLDTVRTHGPISRVELATSTGLSPGAITHLVRALLKDGLLVETGQREYTGGQPRVMLTLNPRSRRCVGILLGADWTVAVVVDASGTLLARARVRGTRSAEPDAVITELADHVDRLLDVAGVERSTVVGIGLAASGMLDLDAGTIVASQTLARWKDFPVRDRLAAATGLAVHLDNDAVAAAAGEFWTGATGGSRAHGTVYMGAAISAGFVVNGSLYRGASSNVGAIGAMRVHGERGRRGTTIDDLAGPAATAARARVALTSGTVSTITLSADSDPFTDFAAVATAAANGDRLAIELIEESAEYLADILANVVNLLDLDSVSLTGPSFASAGSTYLPVIERRLRAERLPGARGPVTVTLAAQLTDAAATGAAAIVLQRELAPR